MWSRELPAIPSSVTVIKDSAHRYFLSFIVEVLPEVLPKTDNSVGIDLGIKTAVKKIDAPKPLRKRMLEVRKTQ
ncbi:MAG: hypothetical protein MGG11_04375 [Trichodesmium sp. MAG_R03]|nr:hypothetical protein [Trichodesmium sp. MAG_R03]